MTTITRREIIEKYGITEGQINFAVTKRTFPKKLGRTFNNEGYYSVEKVESYFKYNPPKKSRIQKDKNPLKDLLNKTDKSYLTNKQAKMTDEFNKMSLAFNIQKREREKKKEPAGSRALFYKYKPIKKQTVYLDDIHEQAEIRQIDSFSQINDFNHRIVINV